MARILVSSEVFANVDSNRLVLPRGQQGYDPAAKQYRTGNGLSVWDDLPIDDTLTAATDAETIAGAEAAKAVTPAGLEAKLPSIVLHPSGGDDTAAIQAAFDSPRKTEISAGTYNTSATLVVKGNVEASADALIISSASPAIELGEVGTTLVRRTVSLPKLQREVATEDTGVGVRFVDVDACQIFIPFVVDFEDGVHLRGDAQGISYNTITFGQVSSFTRNLILDSQNGGWCNQNVFLGGRFTFTRAGSAIADVRQLQLGLSTSATGPDGNTFVGCSFEGQQPEFYVEGYRANVNTFVGCRFETGGGSPRFNWQTLGGLGSIGNRFINCFGTGTAVSVTQSAESFGNDFETHVETHRSRNGAEAIKHRNSNTAWLWQIYETAEDINATGPSSTNWKIAAAADFMDFKNTADAAARVRIRPSGVNFGNGTAAPDVLLTRGAADNLRTTSDIEVSDNTNGFILRAPDNSRWRITVDNSGVLGTAAL